MQAIEIEKKVKTILNSKGDTIEVILPYKIYKKLLELQIGIDIYQQKDTQESIRRAKEDIKQGKIKKFKDIDHATEWLDS